MWRRKEIEEDNNDASMKRGDEKRHKTEAVDEKNAETSPAFPLNEKGTRRFLKRTYKSAGCMIFVSSTMQMAK